MFSVTWNWLIFHSMLILIAIKPIKEPRYSYQGHCGFLASIYQPPKIKMISTSGWEIMLVENPAIWLDIFQDLTDIRNMEINTC